MFNRVRDAVSKYLPFKGFILLVYVISLACVFLWIVALPLIFLYYSVLCVIAWCVLPQRGRDVIVISDGKPDDVFDEEVLPMIRNRAFFLNYEERSIWSRWSLPVLLYFAFGPIPNPVLRATCLPAVLLIRKFKLPRKFSFGPLISDTTINVQSLRSCLHETVLD